MIIVFFYGKLPTVLRGVYRLLSFPTLLFRVPLWYFLHRSVIYLFCCLYLNPQVNFRNELTCSLEYST